MRLYRTDFLHVLLALVSIMVMLATYGAALLEQGQAAADVQKEQRTMPRACHTHNITCRNGKVGGACVLLMGSPFKGATTVKLFNQDICHEQS